MFCGIMVYRKRGSLVCVLLSLFQLNRVFCNACAASLVLVRLERALNAKAVAEETLEELMPALLQGNLHLLSHYY